MFRNLKSCTNDQKCQGTWYLHVVIPLKKHCLIDHVNKRLDASWDLMQFSLWLRLKFLTTIWVTIRENKTSSHSLDRWHVDPEAIKGGSCTQRGPGATWAPSAPPERLVRPRNTATAARKARIQEIGHSPPLPPPPPHLTSSVGVGWAASCCSGTSVEGQIYTCKKTHRTKGSILMLERQMLKWK